ncbi:variable surface protein [Plasmodium gonderi]|uniref:Variable surface protein n=1 Tax=Plasmodium gonderi TaxID=77519 RepID=A0A1Y1JT22_PLAGO|nr:variable surface protein [Plasmodium gonderi]GAW84605.1 variable surface protein [Plasmodium gonderi]
MEINYTYVGKFPEYKEIIEKKENRLILKNDPCTTGIIGSRVDMQNKFDKDKCHAALWFAKIINDKFTKEPTQELCLYLYYWLRKEFEYNNISAQTRTIYIILLSSVSQYINSLCLSYKKNDMLDDDFQLMDDLYQMYINIYYIKKDSYPLGKDMCTCITECSDKYKKYKTTCESNNVSSFCFALENINNELNGLQNSSDICSQAKCQNGPCEYTDIMEITSPRTNKSKTAIITTILILTIPVLLFIIYKFTPYNSFLHRGLKNIINNFHSFKGARNILKNSELYSTTSWNSSHNILYNSP